MLNTIQEAYEIASKSLKNSYKHFGIIAGQTHFSDLWTRDCCFAGLGSLKMGDVDPVKLSLNTLLNNMSSAGQIPLRVGQKHFLLKYLYLDKLFRIKRSPRYLDDKVNSVPMDSNSLFVILFSAFVKKSGDIQFLESFYDKLKKSLDWNLDLAEKNYLIREQGYAGWADSLNKNGYVLYTNVLHCYAIQSFIQCLKILGKDSELEKYTSIYNQLKETINRKFWTGHFYRDMLNEDGEAIFSTDGNALAILFNIAPIERAKLVMDYVRQTFQKDFCVALNFPDHDSAMVYRPFKWIKLADYHNGLRWLWIGCVEAAAKLKAGLESEAKDALGRLAKKIVEYKGVYEVYEPNGKPVSRLFYKSEKTFSWSSGLFIWACHECGLDPVKN